MINTEAMILIVCSEKHLGHCRLVSYMLLLIPASLSFCTLFSPIQGVGTDEDDLIEILCSRNNAQITEIKTLYKKCKPRRFHAITEATTFSFSSCYSPQFLD